MKREARRDRVHGLGVVNGIDLDLHHGLVQRYVSRYEWRTRRLSLSREDLEQVAYVGLARAAEKYEPGRGLKFSTMARHWIIGAMLDELSKQRWAPKWIQATHTKAGTFTELREMAVLSQVERFAERPIDQADASVCATEAEYSARYEAHAEQLFSSLPPRLRDVAQWRFVEGVTQAEIATRLGVTAQRVQQMVARIRERVRTSAEIARELTAA